MEANTASGTVSNAFEDLRVSGQWGAKKITGRLGAGSGSLKATTVSGSIALLRRPPAEDEPWDVDPEDTGPEDIALQDIRTENIRPPAEDTATEAGPASTPAAEPHGDSGDNSVSGGGDGASRRPGRRHDRQEGALTCLPSSPTAASASTC